MVGKAAASMDVSSLLMLSKIMQERKMLKGIIFDMDGVLINTEPLHYRVWKKTFQDKGL